jgi:hypothetical protein
MPLPEFEPIITYHRAHSLCNEQNITIYDFPEFNNLIVISKCILLLYSEPKYLLSLVWDIAQTSNHENEWRIED